METLSLNGAWYLYKADEGEAVPATVPGCVHTDLLAAGLIEDPFYRDNELKVLWVGKTDWTYRRMFVVPASFLEHERVLLRCEGLDTIATIFLNGQEVGRAKNMFRVWEYDVKPFLRPGENVLAVAFRSSLKYVREKAQGQRFLPAWGVGQHKLDGGGWIRKEPCNFGWDWGPMLATCGIWRDIALVGYDTARLEDVHILQDHAQPGQVALEVRVKAETLREADLRAQVQVRFEGEPVAEASVPLRAGEGIAHLVIRNAKLWWPNGLGAQPLYEVHVTLTNDAGRALDEAKRRIGLRTLRLVRKPDAWGESFYFAVNGVPFFAKGANWIPRDVFITRLAPADYRRALQDAAEANMNMLRVWGGGIYEQDIFYDLCDELGLCIWQDFIFACATYPTFDAEWMTNVRIEVEENVQRLRHHACLALWCGNNELEQGLVGDEWTDRTMSWEDYGKLFDEMIPEIVHRLDLERDYWPSSPHSPCGDRRDFNNPTCGDAHLWSVWHGRQPFEWYRTCTHRFNSEFGFQSFPEPRTVYSYTEPSDRNVTSWVMEHHQRSAIGNGTIMTYMCDWFRLPKSFEMTLWLSQILQGMAIKYAVEHWRRGMPRGMGTLYWQLDDCWPVASWSSVDSFGRWKALHYMARAFFAPLLVSAVEDAARGTVDVHVTSDLLETRECEVAWWVTDAAGVALAHGRQEISIAPQRDTLALMLDAAPYLKSHGPRDLMVWLELYVLHRPSEHGVLAECVSTNWVSFARPKHLELGKPDITWHVKEAPNGAYDVALSAQKAALWCWLDLAEAEARYSDRFFHLRPGRGVTVRVMPAEPLSLEAFREQLRVYSLFDTYA
ncbi:MAG: glycoside hydrolase family 2 protein [Chloroflexi bacterium]|nr:glycoside hydrolase family 2 protein [Chloroflexota bacterium]